MPDKRLIPSPDRFHSFTLFTPYFFTVSPLLRLCYSGVFTVVTPLLFPGLHSFFIVSILSIFRRFFDVSIPFSGCAFHGVITLFLRRFFDVFQSKNRHTVEYIFPVFFKSWNRTKNRNFRNLERFDTCTVAPVFIDVQKYVLYLVECFLRRCITC